MSSESECVMQRTPFFVKSSGWFVTFHLNFYFVYFDGMGSHRNYESPWWLDKTSLVVWLQLSILGLLITKITWWITVYLIQNKLYYFTIEITRETILEV